MLNALILGERPTGYTTVIREYLTAFSKRYRTERTNIIIYVLIQKCAVRNIDPMGSLAAEGMVKFITICNLKTSVRVVFEQFAVNYHALRLKCDCIHSPATLGIVFPVRPQLLFFHASTTFMLPRKMHGRGWLATKMSNWIIKCSANSAREVAVTTYTTGRELQEFLGRAIPFTTIGNGVQNLRLSNGDVGVRDEIKQIPKVKFLLYVSSFYRLKNQRILIEAAAELPGYRVVLAGGPAQPDYYSECEKLVRDAGGDVKIVSSVNNEELAYLYRNCDIYVCPSQFEGFALTPLEALQFNKPILLAETDVLREVYGQGFRYFDQNSVESLVSCVNSVSEQYRKFCENNGILKQYDWGEFAKKNFDLYRKILS
ncbi:glycosyltransferase [Burkholderia sp. Bp8998]|uniref:glycosyltransferase n=1 Tax=Burkholderia sp. Bp8998 TaxID=2184557 RepID=UPI00163A69A4|nr:glycosyltransferase [Burkholderia sp. Bp8998]